MAPVRRCWAQVDLDALAGNFAWIRERLPNGVRILAVVKADAYGHGLEAVAARLMRCGVDAFGVANLEEAAGIRRLSSHWPVLLLSACLPEEVEGVVAAGVMPMISTLREAEWFSAAAHRFGHPVTIHLKIDTGMGRLGMSPRQAERFVAQADALPGIRLGGICTHYASVEDEPEFSEYQREMFRALIDGFRKGGRTFEAVHANNSGGLLCEPDSTHTMVRPGLLLYGIVPEGRRLANPPASVRPVLSWKTRVTLVKEVPAGASLSYGRSFIAARPMRIAILSVGYGDGYARAAGNRAAVLIRGTRCRVVGRVTMDQTLVDVSELVHPSIGDETVLIGRQGDAVVTAQMLAEWMGTIPWEVLTGIGARVPRVYHST